MEQKLEAKDEMSEFELQPIVAIFFTTLKSSLPIFQGRVSGLKSSLVLFIYKRISKQENKKEIKGFTHKIKAFTQVFKKLLFPFIYLLVWIFSKTKSKNKRKETVRYVRVILSD